MAALDNTLSTIYRNMIGLFNVDNTSDLNKPISTATQTALDTKAPIINPIFTGSVTLPNVDINTTNNNLAATTGYVKTSITNLVNSAPSTLDTLNEIATALGNDPNLSTTLTTQIGLRAPINNPTFTGTVSGITKTMVGLGNVDNTADTNKPVSTATQTALNNKLNLTGGTLTGGLTGTTAVFSGDLTVNTNLNVLNYIIARLPNYSSNGEAVSAGVPYMGLYRTGGLVMVRLDTIPPTITLLGASSINLNLGSTYTDPGVTVTDNYDTNLSCYITSIGSGSTNVLSSSITVVGTTTTVSQTSTLPVGTYTITYNAYDSSGNIGLNTRTLNIVEIIKKIYFSTSTVASAYYYSNWGAVTNGVYTGTQFNIPSTNDMTTAEALSWGISKSYLTSIGFDYFKPWIFITFVQLSNNILTGAKVSTWETARMLINFDAKNYGNYPNNAPNSSPLLWGNTQAGAFNDGYANANYYISINRFNVSSSDSTTVNILNLDAYINDGIFIEIKYTNVTTVSGNPNGNLNIRLVTKGGLIMGQITKTNFQYTIRDLPVHFSKDNGPLTFFIHKYGMLLENETGNINYTDFISRFNVV